jgi:hypothetical protein
MPTAAPSPIQVVLIPGPLAPQLVEAIIARLVALNSTDPQLQALLAQYQTVNGKVFGT